MASGYDQFCPVAKGAEVLATKWTPLVLRELMCGEKSFNDIHRGVPRMSRALLALRLHQLEDDRIIVRQPRTDAKGHDYHLTAIGDALRPAIEAIGFWGLIHGRDRIQAGDRDSTVLMWALRRRVDRDSLPERRIVVRIDLSGVARTRTSMRLHWLVMQRSGVDVCTKDPGFPVDAVISGGIAELIAVYLGHKSWRAALRAGLTVSGEREVVGKLEKWLRFDLIVGHDLSIVPPAATAASAQTAAAPGR